MAKLHRTDLVICSQCGERKTLAYGRINTVNSPRYSRTSLARTGLGP